LKILRTWFGYIANLFTFEARFKKMSKIRG